MTTTAAQINVRLDPDLKRSGDAALSRAGMTPSQAVRALWQLAASLADHPGALEDILLPSRARAEQRERDMVKAQPSDDEELKRNAYADRYGEEMNWLYE